MSKEILSRKQLEFILQESFSTKALHKYYTFDARSKAWRAKSTQWGRAAYVQDLQRLYKPILETIFNKQPELKELESQLFSNAIEHKKFEKHFSLVFDSKIYFDTLGEYVLNYPNSGLPKARRELEVQAFIKSSASMAIVVHQYLFKNKEAEAKDYAAFRSYLACLKDIPFTPTVNKKDKSNTVVEFFDILSAYKQDATLSETLNKAIFNEIVKKNNPSIEIKNCLMNFFTPYLNNQHTLRKKINTYIREHFNIDLRGSPTQIAKINVHHLLIFEVKKENIIDNYNCTPTEANRFAANFIKYFKKSIEADKSFGEMDENIAVHVSTVDNIKTATVTTTNVNCFVAISKYAAQMENILPKIVQHIYSEQSMTDSQAPYQSSTDLGQLIENFMTFSALQDSLLDKPTPKQKIVKI